MKGVWQNSLVMIAMAACVIGFAATEVNAGATIVIQNNDGSFEGFNDNTPWTPTGGNPATTLGQARLNACQYAADLWSACITSRSAEPPKARSRCVTAHSESASPRAPFEKSASSFYRRTRGRPIPARRK